MTESEELPPFFTRDEKTFMTPSPGEDAVLFGDFSLRFLGEIAESGHWVCVCVAIVLGRMEER